MHSTREETLWIVDSWTTVPRISSIALYAGLSREQRICLSNLVFYIFALFSKVKGDAAAAAADDDDDESQWNYGLLKIARRNKKKMVVE